MGLQTCDEVLKFSYKYREYFGLFKSWGHSLHNIYRQTFLAIDLMAPEKWFVSALSYQRSGLRV